MSDEIRANIARSLRARFEAAGRPVTDVAVQSYRLSTNTSGTPWRAVVMLQGGLYREAVSHGDSEAEALFGLTLILGLAPDGTEYVGLQ